MSSESEIVDREHLKLLSIFYYVLAGITGLFSLLPLLHLALGLALVSGALHPPEGEDLPEEFGWIFVAFAGALIVLGLMFAALLFFTGRCIARRRAYTFCLVVAGLSCINVPLGTVLGVFTIVVLGRPTVKEQFATVRRESPFA